MDAGNGKSSGFRAFPSPRQLGGSKGCLRRLHFMRPFAPCFAELVAGAQVYVLRHAHSGKQPLVEFTNLLVALESSNHARPSSASPRLSWASVYSPCS